MKINISKIVVPDGRCLRGSVATLAESINEIGLLHPIVVLPNNRLVAGLHRMEACKSLGWDEIDATVKELDEAHARIAELDENLCQNQYTVLERSEALAERKSIYLATHPETKKGGAPKGVKPGNMASKNDEASFSSDAARPGHVSAFAADTAQRTGCSTRSIERAVQIAVMLPAETRDVLRGTALEDNQERLLMLCKLPVDELRALTEQGANALIRRINETPRRRHERKEPQPSRSEPPPPSDGLGLGTSGLSERDTRIAAKLKAGVHAAVICKEERCNTKKVTSVRRAIGMPSSVRKPAPTTAGVTAPVSTVSAALLAFDAQVKTTIDSGITSTNEIAAVLGCPPVKVSKSRSRQGINSPDRGPNAARTKAARVHLKAIADCASSTTRALQRYADSAFCAAIDEVLYTNALHALAELKIQITTLERTLRNPTKDNSQ